MPSSHNSRSQGSSDAFDVMLQFSQGENAPSPLSWCFLGKRLPPVIRECLNSHPFSCDWWNVLVGLQLFHLLLGTGFLPPKD